MNAAIRSLIFLAVCSSDVWAVDPELDRVRKAYDGAVQRAVAPLNVAYQKDLQRLLENYTKAGKLDAALEVRAALEKLGVAIPQAKGEEGLSLKEKLITGRFLLYFDPPRSKLMTFGDNGSILKGVAEQESTWKVEGSELLIFNKAGQLSHALRYSKASDNFKTSTRNSIYKARGVYLENAPKE